MKVYLATTGSYSSYRIAGVFARREDAETYELADDVEEYELRQGPADVRDRVRLFWSTWQPDAERCTELGQRFAIGNPWTDTRRADFADHPARPVVEWRQHHSGLVLEVHAWTEAEARQVYGDERAMHDADPDAYPPDRRYLRRIA